MAETPGQRLYLIRLACGDGLRTAEPLKAFAERVQRETGARYDPSALSLLERDKQGWKIEDAQTFSRVDPLKRGHIWLAFGAEPAPVAQDTSDISPKRTPSHATGPEKPFAPDAPAPPKRATGKPHRKAR